MKTHSLKHERQTIAIKNIFSSILSPMYRNVGRGIDHINNRVAAQS